MTDSFADRPLLDRARLEELAPTWRVEILPEAPSTNAVCAERARAGEPAGLAVTTEHQYAGRGRLDRDWAMPPRAAIAVSALVRPELPLALWPWLPLMTGVAVAEAVDGRVKWPNDVLLAVDGQERKVCGILVELVDTPQGMAAVIGAGLNVSLRADELPVPTATSLELARGTSVDRTAVLVDLLTRLHAGLELLEHDPERVAATYTALSATLGRAVHVELPSGESLDGTATTIEADGRLVVRTADGTHAVAAGDVVHARLA